MRLRLVIANKNYSSWSMRPWVLLTQAGIPFEERESVIGIEDSGAGVCAIRLAGFVTVGMEGGNIRESGTQAMCQHWCASLSNVLDLI